MCVWPGKGDNTTRGKGSTHLWRRVARERGQGRDAHARPVPLHRPHQHAAAAPEHQPAHFRPRPHSCPVLPRLGGRLTPHRCQRRRLAACFPRGVEAFVHVPRGVGGELLVLLGELVHHHLHVRQPHPLAHLVGPVGVELCPHPRFQRLSSAGGLRRGGGGAGGGGAQIREDGAAGRASDRTHGPRALRVTPSHIGRERGGRGG